MDLDFHGGEITEQIEYDFSVNIHPCGMPECAKKVLVDYVEAFSKYPDRNCTELRKFLAEDEGVLEGQVLCGNGASELLMAVCAYVAKHDVRKKANPNVKGNTNKNASFQALLMEPTFSGYERCVTAYGGVAQYYHDVKEIENILHFSNDNQNNMHRLDSENKTDLIFICNPNNPTGEIIGRDDIEHIVEVAEQSDTTVVIDECFIDFTHEKSCVSLTDKYSNLIVIKAFTKYYGMAGVRLGYLCASVQLVEEISHFLPEWNVSGIAQLMGIAICKDNDFKKEWKNNTLELIDKERDYLVDELTKLGFVCSTSKANFILLKSPVANLYEALLKKKILVRNCSNFNTLSDDYVRICVSAHEQNEYLINCIKEIVNAES